MIEVEFVLRSGVTKLITIEGDETVSRDAKMFMDAFYKTEVFICYDVESQNWFGVRAADVASVTYGARW
jgi:hypothetical protein